MPANLDNFSILPKMRGQNQTKHTFQLVWNLDLNITSSCCLINLIFKNTLTGYYLVDSIPPELLSYCTIGSFFKNGIKVKDTKPLGDIIPITIRSSENNNISQINNLITDSEYDLSLNMDFNSSFLDHQSLICKRQLCLMCHDNGMKIIIPCSVLAGVYYFRSTSLREAIFSRNLKALYESFTPADETRHAKITLKPGAADDDAKIISRFLSSEFAANRMKMILNHANISKSQQVLKADFPVTQDIKIKARGQLTADIHGNKTFIVFQILEEDSAFPFDSLDRCRWEQENSSTDEESQSFPVNQVNPSNNLTTSNPDRDYIRNLLRKEVSIINPNDKVIRETDIKLIKNAINGAVSQVIIPSDSTVDLSTQMDSPGETCVAKAYVEQHKKVESIDGYEMPLSEFEQMVSALNDYTHLDKNNHSEKVTGYTCSRQKVHQRDKTSRMRLSLKEVYSKETKIQRECAYVRFKYGSKNICLVEIDQAGLPGGCSTYVLVSPETVSDAVADDLVKDYVEGISLSYIKSKLVAKNIILEAKNHPRSNSIEHQTFWRNRLFQIIGKM